MNPNYILDQNNNLCIVPQDTGPSTSKEGELYGLITYDGDYEVTSDGTTLFRGPKSSCFIYCDRRGLTPLDTTIPLE